jgi:hypothetical protein
VRGVFVGSRKRQRGLRDVRHRGGAEDEETKPYFLISHDTIFLDESDADISTASGSMWKYPLVQTHSSGGLTHYPPLKRYGFDRKPPDRRRIPLIRGDQGHDGCIEAS